MVEARNGGQGPERRRSNFEDSLKGELTQYAENPAYKNIPSSMRSIAMDVALSTLLIPRTKLFKTIEELDDIAARAGPKSIAKFDRNENNPLLEQSAVEENRIKPPGGMLDARDHSTIITRYHRKLIAARRIKVRLARAKQFRGMEVEDIFKDPLFSATDRLCRDMIYDISKSKNLPDKEKWDPTSIPSRHKRVAPPPRSM
ncbi:MAG TPA: hypothetical protein VNA13_04470 [Xanthomonadales bacterium]|nr:hypothetical protein [Xanthomonadales bacterium]